MTFSPCSPSTCCHAFLIEGQHRFANASLVTRNSLALKRPPSMVDTILVIRYVQLTIFALIFILASFYSISTLVLFRLYQLNQLLTVNVCLAAIGCSAYWISFYTTLTFFPEYLMNPDLCPVLSYFEMMCTLQFSLSLIAVSVHRCCSIINHANGFFKTGKWIILCIASQWTLGFLLATPRIPFVQMVSACFAIHCERSRSNTFVCFRIASRIGGCKSIHYS